MEYNKISGVILNACITVYKIMGPGLLESIYEQCLMKEFEIRYVKAVNQVPLSLIYKGHELSRALRIIILVESEIILELKSTENMHPVFIYPKKKACCNCNFFQGGACTSWRFCNYKGNF